MAVRRAQREVKSLQAAGQDAHWHAARPLATAGNKKRAGWQVLTPGSRRRVRAPAAADGWAVGRAGACRRETESSDSRKRRAPPREGEE